MSRPRPASVAVLEHVNRIANRNAVVKRAMEGGAFDEFVPLAMTSPSNTVAIALLRERIESLVGEPITPAEAEIWLCVILTRSEDFSFSPARDHLASALARGRKAAGERP